MVRLADRYELAEPLGAGGMAQVTAAYDHTLGRRVAIKLVIDERAGDAIDHERLLREARGAAGLHHPNTVAVFDAGEDDGRPFIVMELVEGASLAERLSREGELPVDETVAIVDGVLAGLAAAHSRGLVHRDVKPSNILLPDEGGVKLADFGIAKAVTEASPHLTATGQVLGTPRYLAPEQAAGEPATPASDLYALGIVAYECLAGRAPFEADTPMAVALAHQRDPVPPLAGTAPHVPASVALVIERSLAKDPGARFEDAEHMRRALRDPAVGATVPMGAAATRLVEPAEERVTTGVAAATPRSRWPVVAGIAALLALIVLALRLGDDDAPEVADPPGADDAAEEAEGHPPPDGDPDQPPEEPDEPEGPGDIDEMIRSLAVDPDEAGEKGEDLLEDLREIRNAEDQQERIEDARDLLEDVEDWRDDGELDADVAERALAVLRRIAYGE